MKVDDFFKEWTGQRPNLCTAFHEAGIEAMAFAEAYHKQQVKLLAAPAVSNNEVAVEPEKHKCINCGKEYEDIDDAIMCCYVSETDC